MNGLEDSKLRGEQTTGTHASSFAFEEADRADEEDSKDREKGQPGEDFALDGGEYTSSQLPDHALHLGSLIPVWKSSTARGGYRFFIGPDCSFD
jgi:hypothetical protein